MTPAIDDTDAIRIARERIQYEVTTDDTPAICEACRGMGFVWREPGFNARAVPCGECKQRREAEK